MRRAKTNGIKEYKVTSGQIQNHIVVHTILYCTNQMIEHRFQRRVECQTNFGTKILRPNHTIIHHAFPSLQTAPS